jgi:hypothetical protein
VVLIPLHSRACGRLRAGVALIDEGDLDAVVGGCRHGLGQMLDLGTVIGSLAGVTCRARR